MMTMNSAAPLSTLSDLLTDLGAAVRHHIILHRDAGTDHRVVGDHAGDLTFAIDRKVHAIITQQIERWPDELKPLLVVAEGFGIFGHMSFGPADLPLKYRLLIDPIDGTRNLMYDKRSAWFLAAIAPDHGSETKLSHVLASAMVELPTTKQYLTDTFSVEAGRRFRAMRTNILTNEKTNFAVSTSKEISLLQGFGQVANFFPGTKQLASQLMEFIVERTLGASGAGQATVFDDQYISTGGQLVELLMGRDRFCCDLRPLFYDIIERRSEVKIMRGLECHPYDMAGLLVAQSAGVIVTDGFGNPLDASFNTSSPVHWCGYANRSLRDAIGPVIAEWLSERLGRQGRPHVF